MNAIADLENPLRHGLAEDRQAEPCTVVIFGASGDLTMRKLMPALYTLALERHLPANFNVVGFARKPMSDDAFRAEMRTACEKFARHRPLDTQLWDTFVKGIFYHSGSYDDKEAFVSLKARLDEIDAQRGTGGNRVFYLSTPPSTFAPIMHHLGDANLLNRTSKKPFTRAIIEKPFGTDLATAQWLNREVRKVADEDQIYRIDHYLGKETVQNMMVFRFANALFEPLWNSRYIDHVQITGAEALGIERRGGYFEQAGILRDMVQNHLFQVLCLTAMEPPVSLHANDLRDEKVKVLKALRPIPADAFDEHVVRAHYDAGSIAGRRLPSYRQEEGVSPTSVTETYVALKIFIDNWRWAGVPFYLRSAKAMPKRVTEVALVFKEAPHRLFGDRYGDARSPNVLSIRIQPDEGISLRFGSKVPGATTEIHPVNMEFRYGTSFGKEPPEAYERLLLDCMLGDAALFTRGDEVEASWTWISRIHQAWASSGAKDIPTYPAGTWGPAEADALLARAGHVWRRP